MNKVIDKGFRSCRFVSTIVKHPVYATRNLCMHDFLKFHQNCDAYMGVQKERKSTFLTTFEHREEEAGSQLVCCTIFLSQLFLNVFVIWELSIQYNPQIFVLVDGFYIFTIYVSVME